MVRRNLSFKDLPTFESSPWFFTLPEHLDARLRQLPATYGRCNAALRFMSQIGADTKQLGARDDEYEGMIVAYLRASLMEFVGMEDAISADLPRTAKPLRIYDTSDAMLVVLRELRNVQIHLVQSNFVVARKVAYSDWQGERREHEVTARTIPLEDMARLKEPRRCPKGFAIADFTRAVDWLSEVQQAWGISDVVMRGIWRYASMIVDAHVPSVTA